MAGKRLIVVVDLKEYHMAVGFECAEVMLFVWIVGVAEIVIDGDGLDDARNGFGTEGRDASSHHCRTLLEVLTQRVVRGRGSDSVLLLIMVIVS